MAKDVEMSIRFDGLERGLDKLMEGRSPMAINAH